MGENRVIDTKTAADILGLKPNTLYKWAKYKKSIPYMKKNHWGRIINIGSISGIVGEAGASLYSATIPSALLMRWISDSGNFSSFLTRFFCAFQKYSC